MPNKDGTANVLDALKSVGIALIAALIIVWVGSSLRHNWLVIPVTVAITCVGAFFATKKSGKRTKTSTIARWGALGLVASVLWFLFS